MRLHPLALAALAALALPGARAFEIDTPEGSELKVRLDLTPKISFAQRLKDPSTALTRVDVARDPGVVNEDDGANNFRKGLVSKRAEVLAELDVSGPRFGGRLSGTAWYDAAYLGRSDYQGTPLFAAGNPLGPVVPTVNNLPTQAIDEFLPATRRQHGRGSELLDAFVYLKGQVGGMQANLRLGKHTLQWGESLFFGQNGIANAQGPVDIAKIVSVPNWQFKEVLLPVEQVSGTPARGRWRAARRLLPVQVAQEQAARRVGSYFSQPGLHRRWPCELRPCRRRPAGAGRQATTSPGNAGQYGVQLRMEPHRAVISSTACTMPRNYHDKTPSALVFDFVRGQRARGLCEGDIRVGRCQRHHLGGAAEPGRWKARCARTRR